MGSVRADGVLRVPDVPSELDMRQAEREVGEEHDPGRQGLCPTRARPARC